MATRANYVKIGLFVILGFAAALALAVGLGAAQGHREKVLFFTYLNESVQGLDVGAPVTFRGVRVGQVGEITIAPDHRLVAVRMDIDVRSMEQLGLVSKGDFKARHDLPPAPSDLRAQLGSQGLTGNKYMSVDFFDPRTNPPPQLSFLPPDHYLPATTSLTKGLEDSLARAMDKVTDLVDHATVVVDGVGRVVSDLDEGAVGRKATRALSDADGVLQALDRVVGGLDRARVAENAGATIEALRTGADKLNKLFGRLDGDHGLVATTQRSVMAFGDAGRNVAGATHDLDATLVDIREAAAAIRSLADELEREPDVLLKGRARGSSP
jgi:phospholipid/cholesterol/gamma-HCH transport system substrate-binding protein